MFINKIANNPYQNRTKTPQTKPHIGQTSFGTGKNITVYSGGKSITYETIKLVDEAAKAHIKDLMLHLGKFKKEADGTWSCVSKVKAPNYTHETKQALIPHGDNDSVIHLIESHNGPVAYEIIDKALHRALTKP